MKSTIDEDGVLTRINKEGDDCVHVEQEEESLKPISAAEKEQSFIKQEEDQLRSAKAQMGEVREENERLKQLLSNIVKSYESLQMHLFQILQQEGGEKSKKLMSPTHQVKEEKELIFLSLGRNASSTKPKKEEKRGGNNSSEGKEDIKFSDQGLSLGLDSKFEIKKPISENSFEETKEEEEQTETCPPNKVVSKTMRSEDEEVLQEPQTKKTRVSVRARCDTPTMHDGCQWRKYGQKVAKGNPCPRAYYRCTISPNCPVRKQVQRCIEDMSILITTYEGTHNHPLPVSATAMAATTSAAASMINSRSSTSSQLPGSLGPSISAPVSATTLPIGLNFSLYQNTRPPPQLIPFPNTSISTSNSHPTITIDLTTPTTTSYNHFNTSLNFSSPSPPPTLWNTNYSTYGSLTNQQPPNNQHLYQPHHMQFNNSHQSFNPSQQSITAEAITQATKVMIATNPMFRSALEAAISNFVGNNNGGIRDNSNLGHFGLNLKMGQSMGFNETVINSTSSNQSGSGGCGSSTLSKSHPSLSSQVPQGSLALFPPSLPLPVSRSASGSPVNSRGSS